MGKRNVFYCIGSNFLCNKKSLAVPNSTARDDIAIAVPPFLNESLTQTSYVLMITESPFPIKGHSGVVLGSRLCRILTPYASLSEHF